MNGPTTVEGILALYEQRGHQNYGESVTLVEHSLQCASLAQRDGARDELVVAALLHDVGHLVVDVQGDEYEQLARLDDVHEAHGARILAPIFGPDVAQSVALHVTAKRWRCAREPDYYDRLSRSSQATLRAQGGVLNETECARFEDHPAFHEALWLRTWDDTGKVAGLETGTLRDWVELVSAVAAAR